MPTTMVSAEDPSVSYSNITREERNRFQEGFPDDAEARIHSFLAWRKEHALDGDNGRPPSEVDDAQVWSWAVRKAFEYHRPSVKKPAMTHRSVSVETQSTAKSSTSLTSPVTDGSLELPQVVFNHKVGSEYFRDKSGHRVLHILAARLDPSLADASLYATAIALYLDRVMDRKCPDQFTLLLDVRPGTGWCNLPALELVGFTRHVAGQLQTLFPERLHKCVLFPVPRPAVFLWNLFKVFLHESTRQAVCVVAGGAHRDSPVPRSALRHHVPDVCVEHCEQVRLAHFVESSY